MRDLPGTIAPADLYAVFGAITSVVNHTDMSAADILAAVSSYLNTPRFCRCRRFPAAPDEMCSACREVLRLEELVGVLRG